MSSFVKVCTDFSNNLKNIGRIPWSSSSSSSSNSSNSAAASPSTSASNGKERLVRISIGSSSSPQLSTIGNSPPTAVADSQQASTPRSEVGPTDSCDAAGLRLKSPTRAAAYTVADIKQRLFAQGLKLELSPRMRRKRSSRYREYMRRRCPQPHLHVCELWSDAEFMRHFLQYVGPREYGTLARVCRLWHSVLIDGRFWSTRTRLAVDLRRAGVSEMDLRAAASCLASRGLHTLELRHARDQDLPPIAAALAPAAERVSRLRLAISALSDQCLLDLVHQLDHVTRLELYCCNDLTDAGLQACLTEARHLQGLALIDCVHISDRAVSAIACSLPWLNDLSIQAYHVTDASMSLFSAEQSIRLEKVRFNFCMELTNLGVRNLVLTLRGLRELSLAGCSKITDDAVDILCENLKQLTALDLSWCVQVTDGALECISVDLRDLRELKLDRCAAITDFGINYLTNLNHLRTLCLRFCTSLSDTSLIHILNIISLRSLSLAGCRRFTENGLCALVRHGRFRVLELSHCPAFTESVRLFMEQDMPHCVILT